MIHFDLSPPGLVCFGAMFVLASLVALALYWIARSSKVWVKWLSKIAGILAGLAAVLFILVMLGSKSWPYPFIFLGLTIVLSAVQAAFERIAQREPWTLWQQWGRAFVTYLVSGLVGVFMDAYGGVGLVALLFPGSRTYVLYNMTNFGYLTGGALAPIAISFFRWMLSSIQLRPGVDRHLEDGERRMDPEVAA